MDSGNLATCLATLGDRIMSGLSFLYDSQPPFNRLEIQEQAKHDQFRFLTRARVSADHFFQTRKVLTPPRLLRASSST
jgi:hypothetical protein